MKRQSPVEWFVAASDAAPSEVRAAGRRSVVAGLGLLLLAIVVTIQDPRWFGGAIHHSNGRIAMVLAMCAAWLCIVQGLYRWVTGEARGAEGDEEAAPSQRVLRGLLVVVGGVGLLAVFFGGMVAITPREPTESVQTISLPLPRAGQNEVHYAVGDASVSIMRRPRVRLVMRDGGLAAEPMPP
jgi:hypothetical protein